MTSLARKPFDGLNAALRGLVDRGADAFVRPIDPPNVLWPEVHSDEARAGDDPLSDASPSIAPRAAPEAPTGMVTNLPPIVQRDGRFWLRRMTSEVYDHSCSQSDLRVVMRDLYPSGTLLLHDREGAFRSLDKILADYSAHIKEFRKSYTATETTFEPRTGTLHEGFRLPTVRPACDPDVEDFLRALVGGRNFDELEEWIKGCRRDRLHVPAAALFLVGPPGVGKSLLSIALAHLWGIKPIRFQAAMAATRFQHELTEGPFLVIEEQFPEKLRQSEFSDIVQSTSRRVERKGVDQRTHLHGCFRIMAMVNSIERVQFTDCGGADAVQALSDRIALFTVAPGAKPQILAALERLRPSPNSPLVDVDRIAGHLAWIQLAEPRTQRFLGGRIGSDSKAMILRSEVERAPELFEWLESYLTDPETFERTYVPHVAITVEQRKPSPGALRAFPAIVHDGYLHVYPKALAAGFGMTLADVHRALKPFRDPECKGTSREIRGHRAKYWRLDDVDLSATFEDADAVSRAMSEDTADRLERFTAKS